MKSQVSQGTTGTKTQLHDVLVVDVDPRTSDAFGQAAGADGGAGGAGGAAAVMLRTAATLDQASLEMRKHPAELVVLNVGLQDNQGLELVARMRRNFPQSEVVALARSASPEMFLGAFRAGAADLLVGPVNVEAAQDCLHRAHIRRAEREKLRSRNVRLRSVCKQLNKARHEISQQVNLLCHDLVKAYQELAQQLSQAQTCGEFGEFLGNEVEIETLMRQTMEWVLKKFGPVNAAVFLPDAERNFTLGAFLNYDTNADAMFTDLVATTLIPQAAPSATAVTIETDQQLRDLFGQQAGMLLGRTWLLCGAYYRNECLAVVAVFRGQNEPLDPAWAPILEAASPVLAEKIGRAIRVYQRGLPSDADEGEDDAGGEMAA